MFNYTKVAATMVALAMTLGVAQVAHAAPVLPAGFALTEIEVGQAAYDLTDFDYLSDDSIIAVGKSGKVTRTFTYGGWGNVTTLPVRTAGDLGLTGIAVAPDFATTSQIYTTRAVDTTGGKMLRLSRWKLEPDRLINETVLLDVPGRSDVHAMTGVVAAADGSVWVSVGDNADFNNVDPLALDAQNIDKPYGKLFHLDHDGRGVPSNPFYQTANPYSLRSKVYAYGFRSPFRFSLNAAGTPYLGDVGWNTWEEVDKVLSGTNYGWPCWEGTHPTPGYADLCNPIPALQVPIVEYQHGAAATVTGNSVTGGTFYTGNTYPAEYQGAYFFGDYVSKRIWAKQEGQAPTLVGTDLGGPVKFLTASNGDIVYANIYSGKLRRLSYTPGNRTPVAALQVNGSNPSALEDTFNANDSYDPDGDALTYAWNFGDGQTQAGGTSATHRYLTAGTYMVALTVTDPTGASNVATTTVVPANYAPTIAATFPTKDYAVGESVVLHATAQDTEDGDLSLAWATELLHCPAQGCHSHPAESYVGNDVSILFTDHGGDTKLHVVAVATDSSGQETKASYIAEPRLHLLTLAANYPAKTTVNGVESIAERVVEGGTVTVTAPATADDGVATFDKWSNGAVRSQQLQMPAVDLKLTATYLTPIDRRYATDAAFKALLGAPTAGEVNEGAVRTRTYQFGRAYWTVAAGVHEVHGAILTEYLAQGGTAKLGPPTTDETKTPDGIGRFNHFNGFGSVYWSPNTGAHAIYGAIKTKWAALGWELGILGYPTTSEAGTPDGVGRFNHFSKGGSIYWAPGVGAFEVHGWIKDRWAALGWELSYLGYPTSDEFATPCGRRSNFQHGYVELCNGIIYDRGY